MRIFGIVLAIVGALMLIFNGFNYTTKEKVVDLGPLEVNAEKEHTVAWPMYAGGAVLVAGIIMIVAGARKKA